MTRYVEVTYNDCSSIYGSKQFDQTNMTHEDSVTCLKIEHIPLQGSSKVLCIERNYLGDTLGIGLKNEVPTEKPSWFYIRDSDRLTSSFTTWGEKVGQWIYYHPDGSIRKKEKY